MADFFFCSRRNSFGSPGERGRLETLVAAARSSRRCRQRWSSAGTGADSTKTIIEMSFLHSLEEKVPGGTPCYDDNSAS
ncbi:hypothetical protein E2562_005327 [Oryza meyeriana var. granulata]|uniref:Uncharacterized protein n=1 Tax=Oryza meyeriana var. granulata TaxID=110450 RepID=A0A6G1DEQ8_9ORYZ|nr:hypothetical protein E2562_005327 [Oryza meyeriana var. granulata]